MTELLYQTDSMCQAFDAVVTQHNEEMHAVALDRTAFYPGGGGQPNDSGRLVVDGAAIPVTKTKKVDGEVWHTITAETDLPRVGTTVHGVLDWERRYQLMRTHTAMHILCGVVWRDYGASVTGGDMDPLKGRMDFEFEQFSADLVHTIEEAVNREVAAGRDVYVKILPREEAFQIPDLIRTKINLLPEGIREVRTVEIVGLDLQADGGTHVLNTSEVGTVRVVKHKSKGKINKRIYVEIE
ncbi:MAG: alanyl-tRNA editing protein [Anaerolineae bacterium]|jgi:misacylated tRNA(Ala) deacylase|nr:alanyl-tRNA editing protein [Anaerolineae bacterium]